MPRDHGRQQVLFRIEQADVTTFDCDVLLLKFAQRHHGVDAVVASALSVRDPSLQDIQLKVGESCQVRTRGAIAGRRVLFVGTRSLHDVDYVEIRNLISTGLQSLADSNDPVRHLAITLHGAGYGLDESEALKSELRGIRDAIIDREFPVALEQISLVERNPGRVQRLRASLPSISAAVDGTTVASSGDVVFLKDSQGEFVQWQRPEANNDPQPPRAPVKRSQVPETSSHIFVAMPFEAEMDDIFFYGIQQPIHRVGYICERCDQTAFTGDVLRRIKDRIEDAALVVADLTTGNANVYLEVGYAWGKEIPTLLLAKSGHSLLFDVQGHRCLFYDSIRDLDEKLGKQIEALRTSGVIRGPSAP